MATLVHIDSSFNHTTSVSRGISGAFASAWREAHTGGKYIYRDLAGDTQLAHLDSAAFAAARIDEGQHTPEQAERWAVTKVIVDELLAAATVVTARGGSYAPGAPRAHFDFQEPYLRAFFSQVGLL